MSDIDYAYWASAFICFAMTALCIIVRRHENKGMTIFESGFYATAVFFALVPTVNLFYAGFFTILTISTLLSHITEAKS